MPTPTYPTSSGRNIVVGGVGYLLIKEVKSDGSELAVPDTWHTLGFIGTGAKFSRKPTIDSSKQVTAKTNAMSQEIQALAAYDATSAATNTAPDITITWALQESSLEHLNIYDSVKARYYILCFPKGQRGSKWVDEFYFGKIDDGGDENSDTDKNTELTMTMKVQTNNAAISAMAAPTDPCVQATTFTIPQYAGFVRVGT